MKLYEFIFPMVCLPFQIVNIVDAYDDPRFNPDIDKKTGYKTKSILCMPIVSKNGVLGVVQMVNRLKGDHFTKEDESTFRVFAVYCALALHYSRIYNLLTHQQSKYKVSTICRPALTSAVQIQG